jgi:hypothetical protein
VPAVGVNVGAVGFVVSIWICWLPVETLPSLS